MMGRRTVAVVAAIPLAARRADDPAGRHRQPDVVDAEVGEELSRTVKLMTVPALGLEDANLWKPVRDEVVIADRSGARVGARHP
jgi:hypothetical protein